MGASIKKNQFLEDLKLIESDCWEKIEPEKRLRELDNLISFNNVLNDEDQPVILDVEYDMYLRLSRKSLNAIRSIIRKEFEVLVERYNKKWG